MSRLPAVLLIALGLLIGGLTPAVAAEQPQPARHAQVTRSTAYEKKVITRTNHRRADHGLRRVKSRPCLERFANRWARHMARTHVMVHQDLGPILRRCHLSMVGENIAYGYPTAKSVVHAWMHSPGHRGNILNGHYRRIGVGAARDASGVYWVSQVFGRHV